MKALKTLVVCSLLLVGGQSFANITPIKFAKGSSCGSFSGNASGRTFTLQLNANQELIISSYDFYADTRNTIVNHKVKLCRVQVCVAVFRMLQTPKGDTQLRLSQHQIISI